MTPERFADPAAPGSFFDTADDAEALLHRPRDLTDNATPSGAAALAGAPGAPGVPLLAHRPPVAAGPRRRCAGGSSATGR